MEIFVEGEEAGHLSSHLRQGKNPHMQASDQKLRLPEIETENNIIRIFIILGKI